jgi:cytochrome c oxidase cbb3-type subunit 3
MRPFLGPGRSAAARCAAMALLMAAAGCHDRPAPAAAAQAPSLTAENRLAAIPLGDKATGPDKDVAPLRNPYAGSPQAVEAGKRLFVKMNCAGCHAYTAKGWMGPDLSDKYWRYGGSDDEIYKTLYEGRPQGMPAWGKTLPPEQLWQLVTYIQSLSGKADTSTAGGKGTGEVPATRTDVAIDVLPPGANAGGNNPSAGSAAK